MDQETLSWIKNNNPHISLSKISNHLQLEAKNYAHKFVPNTGWFTDTGRTRTIHGKRHLIRVCIYTFLLVKILKFDIRELDTSLVVASLHDLRRETDKSDNGHALKSADWFVNNIEKVSNEFNVKLTKEQEQKIYYGILLHEIPYELIDKAELNKYRNTINIIKTADALDRYIQPKLKWRLNEDYLMLKPKDELKQFAFDLIVKSEESYLKGASIENSIFESLPL